MCAIPCAKVEREIGKTECTNRVYHVGRCFVFDLETGIKGRFAVVLSQQSGLFVVERIDPNKNYTCFIWGFALTLDVNNNRG